MNICNHEVQRLQRLVSDLLDLARIQNGVDVFRLRPMAVGDKVAEVLEIIRRPASEKKVHLVTKSPAGGSPLICELDPDRFAQIVQNLLYNAIRFTPSDGTVTVELRRENGEAALYIRDTGIGMNETELQRIWDRFYKAQASRSSAESDGTGLGLTIVKHLVGAMKGTIGAESEVGGGTVFRVAFPPLSNAMLEKGGA
ncbi:HAMP domain-containing histidine kinase [Paenibacillus sp. P25]|nr:HAMP domain-containing histidine kinase [Paenibacillus sp. P25]